MSNKQMPVAAHVARAALAVIPADDRDVWWRMGMALKSEYGEEGFYLFQQWSETSASFDSGAVKSTWKSFKPGGRVTIGTLIAEAKKYGFNPKVFAPAKPMTAADKERVQRERAIKEAKIVAETARAQEAAAIESAHDWDMAADNGVSPYLVRKGAKGYGLRYMPDSTVLVPLRDAAGKLWSVQRIFASGGKRFPSGGRMSGCFHVIGDLVGSPWVLIAEGYATAATLHEASGYAVAVAFNEGNVKHVAAAIRRQLPDARMLLCADDDRETEAEKGKNPGVVAATVAAAAVGAIWCKPEALPAGGTDFNDMACASGIDAVRTLLATACAAAEGSAAPSSVSDATAQVEATAPAVASGDTDVPAPTDAGSSVKACEPIERKPKRKPAADSGAQAAAQASRPFFHVDDEGVWYHGFSQQGDPLPAQWICSELHVTAQSRDSSNSEWGYLLEFQDGDNNPKRWAMPASMLAGDGTQYRATLLSMGLRIGSGMAAKNHLSVYIQTERPETRVRCTDRIGWHEDVYVLPDRTIGGGDELVMFQAAGGVVSQFKQRGTLAEWRDQVAKHCQGNSRMLFCVSAAFAAPLLYLAHVPSGGFHIWGDSSSGKSTAFKVAGSVFGGKDYPRNWRMTDNALETVAAQHSDALLLLDEIAQVDAKVVGDTVYMLANEAGKGRATQSASARKVATWRVLFLSDGEISLANHMEQAGKGTKAGHDVRMAHIAADAGKGYGIYESLNGFASGAALSDHLVTMAHQHYGAAGMAFINYAVENTADLREALQASVPELAKQMCPADSHGQVARVATRFALVGAAGEIATEAGITGWEPGEAMDAARTCFAAWLDGRGGAGNVEHTTILRQVSAFFQAHGEARFTWWHRANDPHKPNTINRAGFRRMVSPDGKTINPSTDHYKEYGDRIYPIDAENTQVEYIVFTEVFRNEICKGYSDKTVAKLLIEKGLLMPSTDGTATRQERLPGGVGKDRVYRFTAGVSGFIG